MPGDEAGRPASGGGALSRHLAVADFLSSPALELALPFLMELAEGEAAEAAGRGAALADSLRSALAGRYTIERELGRGGMATVFLAHDLRHGRAVAVKVVERALAAGGAARFLREIRIAAGITHPHVLGVHDSGEADGLLYYVMPYVEGETLRARLTREGALPVADAVRLLRELTEALRCAHERGVVHRDLKPENVLLSGGHAVVADFGIARALAQDDGAREGTEDAEVAGAPAAAAADELTAVRGTPAYMAPEQAGGSSAVNHRADLYALGVMAYEMVAGVHPFAGRPRWEMLRAHQHDMPEPLRARRPDTPLPLAELVMRLLQKDPAERPADAGTVLRALDGVDAAAPPPAPATRTIRAGAAAALLLALALGGHAAWRGRTTRDTPTARPAGSHMVAVLPFTNVSGEPGDEYFSEGIADELSHALSRLPRVRVVGRTSSHALRGRSLTAREIGQLLDAGELVTGTVRRAGGRVRVAAQLVGTADGKVVWDSVFESRTGDVFALQDEFTRAIVSALAPVLGEAAPGAPAQPGVRGTTDQEAYDLYLQGRYHWRKRGADNLRLAIDYYTRAIRRDPSFARAHAELALVYAMLPGFAPEWSDSAPSLAMAGGRRALALDSTLAEAHLALGSGLDLQLHFREALAEYRRGMALDPSSATALHLIAFSLLNLGATDSALVVLRTATQLDPLATSPASLMATTLLFGRRYEEAMQAARHALSLDPTFGPAILTLGLAQTFGGQPDSAVATLERATTQADSDPRLRAALVHAYVAAGRWADAERMRRQLHDPRTRLVDGTEPAFAELAFGDPEPLVRALTDRKQLRRYAAAGNILGCNPLLDPLWRDPRFRASMQSLDASPCPPERRWPIGQPPSGRGGTASTAKDSKDAKEPRGAVLRVLRFPGGEVARARG